MTWVFDGARRYWHNRPGAATGGRWNDETVGHICRYDRGGLDAVLRKANLEQVPVWSVGVPTINMLFSVSLWMVARSGETAKMGQSQREQTETSGIRDIPWKTVFPSWVSIILNRTTRQRALCEAALEAPCYLSRKV